jgi:hypothetical protein
MRHHVYQIYYDEITKNAIDSGFTELDNSKNERPDWSEYWPIRKYLLDTEMDPTSYYGFLSPKFQQKTGLTASDVYKFLDTSTQDIIAFSPYFDQSTFFFNVFQQASTNHENIFECLSESFNLIKPEIASQSLIMTSQHIIFCNYFIAKRHVWHEWFTQCEKLFYIAEENSTELGALLNQSVNHSGAHNPAKVFVIERMISYLLATNSNWSARFFNPINLPYSSAPIAKYKNELIKLDALKIAFKETGFIDYLETYMQLRTSILSRIQS